MDRIYWKAGVRSLSTNTDGLLSPAQGIKITNLDSKETNESSFW